jgi:hypothetical protein
MNKIRYVDHYIQAARHMHMHMMDEWIDLIKRLAERMADYRIARSCSSVGSPTIPLDNHMECKMWFRDPILA